MTITGPIRGVLQGEGKFAHKVYFFKEDKYWRYDVAKDYGEVDYPQSLQEWNLPGDFSKGIDAVIPGEGRYAGYAYFFQGRQYVRYDWTTGRCSPPRRVLEWSRGFPFVDGIDAAIPGRGKYVGKAYFFKDSHYARFDWKKGIVETLSGSEHKAPIEAWGLGAGFTKNLNACLNLREGLLGRQDVAYFFSGSDYVKYDWTTERVRAGYPMPITAGWPSGCAVWASHGQAPTNVSPDDPRLDEGRARIAYPGGDLRGQAGWQGSAVFADLNGLASKLEQLVIPKFFGDDAAGRGFVPAGRITRLGMNAHGSPGTFHVNGPSAYSDRWSEQSLTEMHVLQNHRRRAVKDPRTGELGEPERGTPGVSDSLRRIAGRLAPGAPVLLLGCNAGHGPTGQGLLEELSKVMPGHPVTAFTSIGYAGGPRQKRPGEPFYETGMRDTNFLSGSRPRWPGDTKEEDERVAKHWSDLDAWPWASEYSPRAKTALNGVIIKTPTLDVNPEKD